MRQSNEKFNATCNVGYIYNLALDSDSYNLIIFWQTLPWLDKPEFALHELVRICKLGGVILASSDLT